MRLDPPTSFLGCDFRPTCSPSVSPGEPVDVDWVSHPISACPGIRHAPVLPDGGPVDDDSGIDMHKGTSAARGRSCYIGIAPWHVC